MMLDHEGRSNLRNGPSQAKKKEEKEGGKSERNEKQHLPDDNHPFLLMNGKVSLGRYLPPSLPPLPPSLLPYLCPANVTLRMPYRSTSLVNSSKNCSAKSKKPEGREGREGGRQLLSGTSD